MLQYADIVISISLELLRIQNKGSKMATIYIADETKLLLDKLSEADRGRPLVDVVGFLVEERAKQLGILADTTPSTEEIKTTNPNTNSQAELSQKESETLKNQ